ncbi:MAG: UvrD-helicase domain-containing protein, partial [Actinomycetota bacterium]
MRTEEAPFQLDESQQQAVDHTGSPLLLLGGPGTGKTAVLERRFLRLASSEVAPHRILLLCSNRSYSLEAKDRLVWALPTRAMVEVPVYTWHALAYHLVTRYYTKLDYGEPPVLLTAPEQWGVVRELLQQEDGKNWPVWGARLSERAFIDEVADFCLRVEQRMLSDEDLAALAARREGWEEVVGFYSVYRDRLAGGSRLDYAGLIGSAVRLLEEDTEVKEALHRRFPHVLVDDGQEISFGERKLLARLDTSNLVVAADPDSGIETFRGAEPDWIYGFEGWFGPHATVSLLRSHRLGEPMLSAAVGLVSGNDPSASHRPSRATGRETSFEAGMYSSAAEEVDAIARQLRHLHLAEGVEWEEMAVLISQPAFLVPPLIRALQRWEVPFTPMSRDRPLASEPVVACFLDLVRVALRTDGWESVLPNLLTSPLIGLDYAQRREMEREAWQQRRGLPELVEESEATAEFRALRDLVDAHGARADECFWEVYAASSYYQGLAGDGRDGRSDEDLDALVAFSHALGRFVERRRGKGSISDYLHEAARADFGGDPWLPPARSDRRGVALLTFHSSRGREWHTV